jgi:hypothetical protein
MGNDSDGHCARERGRADAPGMNAASGIMTLVPLAGLIPLGFMVLAAFMRPLPALVRPATRGAGRVASRG